jgi:hypothetical protein
MRLYQYALTQNKHIHLFHTETVSARLLDVAYLFCTVANRLETNKKEASHNINALNTVYWPKVQIIKENKYLEFNIIMSHVLY